MRRRRASSREMVVRAVLSRDWSLSIVADGVGVSVCVCARLCACVSDERVVSFGK